MVALVVQHSYQSPSLPCRHLGQDQECRIIMRGYVSDPAQWLEDYAEAFQVSRVKWGSHGCLSCGIM